MERSSVTKISSLIHPIGEQLADNLPIRIKLPVWGRIHMDRQLPFLCIYRKPADGNDKGTEKFAQGEASHLVCSAELPLHRELSRLTHVIAEKLVRQFGACLVMEIWAGHQIEISNSLAQDDLQPAFRIISPERNGSPISAIFQNALGRIGLNGNKASISTRTSKHCCPENLPPLISASASSKIGCHVLGIEISSIYRDPVTGEVYPDILRQLDRQFATAVQRGLFDYTRKFTTHSPPHYHSLGRRALVKAVWEVDRILATVSDSLELLLNVTPVNARESWRAFKRNGYKKAPQFFYRPLPVDPVVLKRWVYKAPVDRLEDPALSQLFREKMEELDRQINMLRDRGTPGFLHACLPVYGGVEPDLLRSARDILGIISPRCREGTGEIINAKTFAALARREIKKYQRIAPDLNVEVQVRDDTVGLMVSRGNLLVSSKLEMPASRAKALVQHEVGTHVLTYYNGRSQQLQQLYSGLAGCDALQEGMAVFNEYLVGGLNRARLSLLAARVLAVHCLLEGADFVENFRDLTEKYGFAHRTAFGVLVRVYRGGGFTKDAVYLSGLRKVFGYIQGGGRLEELYIGKIALEHLSIIRELRWREVLYDPPLLPLYPKGAQTRSRLDEIRGGLTFKQMVQRAGR
jgi:uncharacterized protein (TIGR02421 family)